MVRAISAAKVSIRATGLGKATVYRLYPTKDALVAAYLCRLASAISTAIEEQITAHVGDPGGALLAILDAIEADLRRPGFRGYCSQKFIEKMLTCHGITR